MDNNNNNLFSIPFIGTQNPNQDDNPIDNNTSNGVSEQTMPDLLGTNNGMNFNNTPDQTVNLLDQNNYSDNNEDLEKTVIMSGLLEPNNMVAPEIPVQPLPEINNEMPANDMYMEMEQQMQNYPEPNNMVAPEIPVQPLPEMNNQIPMDNGMSLDDTQIQKPDLLAVAPQVEETPINNVAEQSGVPDLLAPVQQTAPETPIEEPININNNGLISPIENTTINTIGDSQTAEPVIPNAFDQQPIEQPTAEPQQNLMQQLSISSLALGTAGAVDNSTDSIDSTVSNMLNNLGDNEGDFIGPDDEDLLKAFFGDKYYNVGRHKFFNIWGFLFRGFYLIYRKMYLMGLLFIILENILNKFVNQLLATIIIGGIIGLFFNILYGMHAHNKIKNIKKTCSSSKAREVCQKKGGTSLGKTIIFIVLYVIIMTILTIVLGIGGFIKYVVDNMHINIGIGDTVSTKYKDHTDYYISKLKVFMNNTDPDQGQEITISDKNLLMVSMPKAKNDGDYVTCVLDNRQSGWHNGEGTFKDGSTNCKEYMENAEKYITADMYPFPDKVTVSFNNKKELGPGTILIYGTDRCMYNQEKKEFECKE